MELKMSKLNEIIKFPKYKLELPISKKEKYFRPFTVREESTILLGKQTEDKVIILKNLIDVVSQCFSEDVSSMSITDFEYCFLKLREKSIGEVEKFTIKCPETQESVDVSVNLLEDILVYNTEPKNKIEIDEGIFIEFNKPSIKQVLENPNYNNDFESNIKFIANCVKKIQNKKEILEGKDLSYVEIKEFIENLSSKQFKKITDYFDELPILLVELKYITSDGTSRSKSITGIFSLINFFFDHITIHTFYQLMFQMKYFHNYSIDEYYELLPWQRQVLMHLIIAELEKEKNTQNNTISI